MNLHEDNAGLTGPMTSDNWDACMSSGREPTLRIFPVDVPTRVTNGKFWCQEDFATVTGVHEVACVGVLLTTLPNSMVLATVPKVN